MSFDFKSLTIRGFDTAFTIGSDLVRDVIYHVSKATAYDPAVGTVTASSTAINCKGMFLGVDNSQRDIKQSDVRVLIRCIELDLLPTTEDWIEDDGVRLEIVSYRRDPLQGAFSFHCRPVPSQIIVPPKSFIIPQSIKDKLQAYWKMDQAGGTRPDSGIASAHLLEDPAHGYAVPSAPGKLGLAAVFNGATVLRNQDTAFGWLILDASSCFINLWLSSNGAHDGFILGRFNSFAGPQYYDYYLKCTAGGLLHFQVKTDDGAGNAEINNILTCPETPAGIWTMVSAVFNADTGEQQLWVNAQLKASRFGLGIPQAGSPEGMGVDFTVGAAGTGSDPSLFFQGKIDEIAFGVVALTPEDIFFLYNGGDGCTW